MVREHIALDLGAAVIVLGLTTAVLPQPDAARAQDGAVEKSDLGQWVWNRDHWVWAEKTDADLHGTEMREGGVADARSVPLHEAGLTVRRTIALAMSAP